MHGNHGTEDLITRGLLNFINMVTIGNSKFVTDVTDIADAADNRMIDLGQARLTEGIFDLKIEIVEALKTTEPIFREVRGVLVKKVKS